MKAILKKRNGYVLIWVLCIFAFIAVASTAIVSTAILSTNSTAIEHHLQQAQFTAKSAAGAVANYILKNGSDPLLIETLMNQQGSGEIANMGDYTVDVFYSGTGKIKVRATARYMGQSASVTTSLIRLSAPSGIIPTDNLLYVNGHAITGLGQFGMIGDVYINGDLNLGQGSNIDGFVVSQGTVKLEGAGNAKTGMFSAGNVRLTASGTVGGDLYTQGDLRLDGSGLINGDAYADGSLTMQNSGKITGSAVIGNNVDLSGGSPPKIRGDLTYGQTLSFRETGSVSNFVFGTITNQTPPLIDPSQYVTQALPVFSAPSDITNPVDLSDQVTVNGWQKLVTVSDSGKFTSNTINTLNSLPYGSTVVFNATAKDLHFRLDNIQLKTNGKGLTYEVETDGTHNVFIYLSGTSSIVIESNEYLGMKIKGSNPRLFIIGDGQQSVSAVNNSSLNACLYLPNGSFSLSGSAFSHDTIYKFVGSCITKNVFIDSNVLLHYSAPDIKDTPLEIFETGGASGSGAWKTEGWGYD